MIPVDKAVMLAKLAVDIVAGNKKDAVAVAVELVGAAVDMVPVDELKPYLTERHRAFVEATVDAAEELKLAGGP